MDTATAAHAVAGALLGRSVVFNGVATDSRTLARGDLFVAIRGENFDGHDYVAQAFGSGAVAAVIAADRTASVKAALEDSETASLLAVSDPLRALGALARFWRARFSIPVAAVVGSNGKTTVKEMTAAILRRHFGVDHVLATAGNLNNEIGLPQTLLRLTGAHRAAVIEIGMNHPGETATLAAIAAPTIGLINNAQREHQEFMKSVADVAAEHAALLAALPGDGVAVINADDEFAPLWRDTVAARNGQGAAIQVHDFALDSKAAFSAQSNPAAWGQILVVATPSGKVSIDLHAHGAHNALNAVAAVATAMAAGADPASVAEGLAAFRPVRGRLQHGVGIGGATVIDDTYNANPDSVRAAIAVLAKAGSPRILVLGDMGEVGDQGVAFHREIGAFARDAGVDRLLALGTLTAHSVEAFGRGAQHFSDADALATTARALSRAGATILVKGSRFMRMERVVAALAGDAASMDSH